MDINAQVAAFNETTLNVFRNYLPNKYIKNTFYKKYIQNGKFERGFVFLENLITELIQLTSSTKALYLRKPYEKVKQSVVARKNLLVYFEAIL